MRNDWVKDVFLYVWHVCDMVPLKLEPHFNMPYRDSWEMIVFPLCLFISLFLCSGCWVKLLVYVFCFCIYFYSVGVGWGAAFQKFLHIVFFNCFIDILFPLVFGHGFDFCPICFHFILFKFKYCLYLYLFKYCLTLTWMFFAQPKLRFCRWSIIVLVQCLSCWMGTINDDSEWWWVV